MGGEAAQDRIILVRYIDDLAKRAPGIANEMLIAINLAGLLHEQGHVVERCDLGLTMLLLALAIFVEEAALVEVAGLAEIGRQRIEVLKGDVGGDIDQIRSQKVAQERFFIASLLKLSTMCSPM